ncbi:hypothetical protein ACLOJK_001197 [Asimina triloba]
MIRRFATKKWAPHRWTIALLALVLVTPISNVLATDEELQTYIIHMDHSHNPYSFDTNESWHRSVLSSFSSRQTASAEEMLVYSYSHVMHGFSARLTPYQLSELEKLLAHRATFKESFGKLFTTHTPTFLGLKHRSGLWPASAYGEDVIIGIINTAVWSQSENFNDRGMPPVPDRWKGKCESGEDFTPSMCNRKLIGARFFTKGLTASGRNFRSAFGCNSPRDNFGHGTNAHGVHGSWRIRIWDQVLRVCGRQRGLAPRARVAMYKVPVISDTVAATDLLAGMDQAIADRVDVMSLSLGFDQNPLYADAIAIGALSAVENGIFVACAAGNDGPWPGTTYNAAPWIMTVGAGTADRHFRPAVTLGNDLTLGGASYSPDSILIAHAPLYYGKGCLDSSSDPSEVAGKVVLRYVSNGTNIFRQFQEVSRSNATAGIFMMDTTDMNPEDYCIPSLVLTSGDAAASIRRNAIETKSATVKETRFKITRLGAKPAPQVAEFSSRGPDPIKPDRGTVGQVTDYALVSGASIASPHGAGVVALLKAIYKDWSPAAIRSAIMTTATPTENTNSTMRDQYKAVGPGLRRLHLRHTGWTCPTTPTDLNHPSFMAVFPNTTTFPAVKNFSTVVTNVGADSAVYKAATEAPCALKIRTDPDTLTFNSRNQKQGFAVSVEVEEEALKNRAAFNDMERQTYPAAQM